MVIIDYLTLKICFHEVDCKLAIKENYCSTIIFKDKDDAREVYNKLISCKEFKVNNDCDLFCITIIITGDATISYDSSSKLLIVLVMN